MNLIKPPYFPTPFTLLFVAVLSYSTAPFFSMYYFLFIFWILAYLSPQNKGMLGAVKIYLVNLFIAFITYITTTYLGFDTLPKITTIIFPFISSMAGYWGGYFAFKKIQNPMIRKNLLFTVPLFIITAILGRFGWAQQFPINGLLYFFTAFYLGSNSKKHNISVFIILALPVLLIYDLVVMIQGDIQVYPIAISLPLCILAGVWIKSLQNRFSVLPKVVIAFIVLFQFAGYFGMKNWLVYARQNNIKNTETVDNITFGMQNLEQAVSIDVSYFKGKVTV